MGLWVLRKKTTEVKCHPHHISSVLMLSTELVTLSVNLGSVRWVLVSVHWVSPLQKLLFLQLFSL